MSDSDAYNPYATPSAELSGGLSREGEVVIDEGCLRIPCEGAVLDRRCVRCNAPGTQDLVRNLQWHHPALYATIVFPGLLVYVLIAVIVRKKASVQVSLCEHHLTLRRRGILLGWLGFFGSGLAMFLAADVSAGLMLAFALPMIASPLIGAAMARVVDAKRIDKVHAWLRVSPQVLDSYRR